MLGDGGRATKPRALDESMHSGRVGTSAHRWREAVGGRPRGDVMATSRERVARNFINRYGEARLRWLLDALADGESGQVIADEFSVSRERVRQWKNAFGRVLTLYQVHPDVEDVLRSPGDS